MGAMMGGVGIMGGPALGILPDPPTVGAVVPGMDGMAGMEHDGAHHVMATMPGMAMTPMIGESGLVARLQLMLHLHHRMMADTVIYRRMMADTALKRMMAEVDMGPDSASSHDPEGHPQVPPAKPRPRKVAPPKPAPTDAMPGMDHDTMPGVPMPADSSHH